MGKMLQKHPLRCLNQFYLLAVAHNIIFKVKGGTPLLFRSTVQHYFILLKILNSKNLNPITPQNPPSLHCLPARHAARRPAQFYYRRAPPPDEPSAAARVLAVLRSHALVQLLQLYLALQGVAECGDGLVR